MNTHYVDIGASGNPNRSARERGWTQCGRTAVGGFLGLVVGLCLSAGCDLQFDKSPNRYEQMRVETAQLAKVLRQVTDEASAKEHEAEITELGNKIRTIQEALFEDAKDNKSNISAITNHRQASLFAQTAIGVVRSRQRICEKDPKACEIVNKALEGIQF